MIGVKLLDVFDAKRMLVNVHGVTNKIMDNFMVYPFNLIELNVKNVFIHVINVKVMITKYVKIVLILIISQENNVFHVFKIA